MEKESPEVIVKVEQKSSLSEPSKPDTQLGVFFAMIMQCLEIQKLFHKIDAFNGPKC